MTDAPQEAKSRAREIARLEKRIEALEQIHETGQVDAIVNGTRYTEREFLARAVRNAIPRGMQDGVPIDECPKWVAVRDAFGCGSGYAHALCHEFNLAPGKIVKRSGH